MARAPRASCRIRSFFLVPLLGLLLLVAVVFPERQDDEAGYLDARNLTHGHYATGRPDALLDADPSYPDLWFGPGLPLVPVGPVAVASRSSLIRLSGRLPSLRGCSSSTPSCSARCDREPPSRRPGRSVSTSPSSAC